MAPKVLNEDGPDRESGRSSSNFDPRILTMADDWNTITGRKHQSTMDNFPNARPNGAASQTLENVIESSGPKKNLSTKCIRRKRFLLPTHNSETHKDTAFKKRRRRKQQMSLENFFMDEDHELQFRFGSRYKEFVLPLGADPLPSSLK